jgi:hypothetical protein
MKYSVICASHSFGLSSKSGEPFSMPRMVVIQPLELVENKKFTCVGAGFTPVEFEIHEDFVGVMVKRFTEDFKGQAIVYDLDVMPRERSRALVVGFSGSAAMPASVSVPVASGAGDVKK